MTLTDLCIKRPVFTMVLNILLIVVGVMSFMQVNVRGYPKVTVPVITVQTDYPGASPSVVESQVTTPIENQLAGISGMDNMHSYSQQGRSRVVLKFTSKISLDSAADEVRNLVGGRFLRHLPSGAEAPLISKRDPNAQEIVLLSLTSKKMSAMALTDYAQRYLLPDLQQVYGVADVQIRNQRDYAMRINLDPLKMAAQQVTVTDLHNALQQQNINVSGGEIVSPDKYYNVFSSGQLTSAAAFNNLVIRNQQGYLLRFKDVAHATVGSASLDRSMRVDGVSAVGLSIYGQSESNPLSIAKSVRKILKHINKTLPSEMHLKLIYDHSQFLKSALHHVYMDLFLAILLVTAVVYLFLNQWRASLIPIVTIPICVISVFSFIYLIGYSINVFTLLALVLAIGLVVDDAIVMLENITRYIEKGMAPLQAAYKGSREIVFAVVAMTLTLAAVFAPIGFAQGMTGEIFRQFAFTLAAAVIISGFVALTLSPMMCGHFLRQSKKESVSARYMKIFFNKFSDRYRGFLYYILQCRFIVAGVLVLLLSCGFWCYQQLPSSLVPAEDMNVFMVRISPPVNASFSYSDNYNKKVEKLLSDYPGVKHVVMYSNMVNGGFAIVTLSPSEQREYSAKQLMHSLMVYTRKYMPESQVSAFSPGTIGGGGSSGNSIEMSIVSNDSFADIHRELQSFISAILKLPSVAQASESLQLNNLQYVVRVRHNLAATLQVNPEEISNTIKTMLGGMNSTTFNWQDRDYDVILQLPESQRKDLNVLNRMYVRSATGKMISVASLATVSQQVLPSFLPHQDRLRADTVQVQISPGYAMGVVVKQLMHLARHDLPENYSYRFRGMARNMLQAYSTQALTFVMSLLFIYLVLCAQFESFIDPWIIMLSVPMAIVGAVVTLYFTGHELSIYASIGLVTLVGLIAKHGILITEFANQQRGLGLAINDAVVSAACVRLRPIIMTTLAMVIGAVPLALAQGANKNGLQPIGWVIVGGMTIGTFFSLVVVPVAYSIFARRNFRAVK